jgi:hypothetical protein
MWIRAVYTIGNALLTIGSVLSLARRAQYFGQRVKHHQKPRYTTKRRTKK